MYNKVPKYYKYIVLFAGDTGEVPSILHISDFNDLKKENANHMHLLDELLVPTLPAVEYCLHMPRCEMDTYDTPIELLDMISDMAHDIVIMPLKMYLMFPLEASSGTDTVLVDMRIGCDLFRFHGLPEWFITYQYTSSFPK